MRHEALKPLTAFYRPVITWLIKIALVIEIWVPRRHPFFVAIEVYPKVVTSASVQFTASRHRWGTGESAFRSSSRTRCG
jgi:hypothetical protein